MSTLKTGWYNSPHDVAEIMYWDGSSFRTTKKLGGVDLLRHYEGKGIGKATLLLTLPVVALIAWWIMPSVGHVLALLIGIAIGAANMYEVATGCRDEYRAMGYPH